jgi:hypothetical protein
LVRRKKWRREGLEQLAWAHMFMEGARKLGASSLVLESSCDWEGALLERGHKLAGTTWKAANRDLIGAGLRQHTKGVFCARVSQTAKGKSRVH